MSVVVVLRLTGVRRQIMLNGDIKIINIRLGLYPMRVPKGTPPLQAQFIIIECPTTLPLANRCEWMSVVRHLSTDATNVALHD